MSKNRGGVMRSVLTAYRFRSDILRDIFKEGVRQGFAPSHRSGATHAYLRCPVCGYQETFTMTGRMYQRELHNKLTSLRRHGFRWAGRGGVHTAQVPSHKD
jgi:hypothetical protein